ncbi:Kinase superfamily protein [Hibiscus syriacus]|uniref:Kinase superfamily protein n=1 Tax=Hibiscus syriacus TaxID=106335 RepID=A0A6A2YR45_HIBSY|nr:Kinase superfamily protein [Hibiscus syriacus]
MKSEAWRWGLGLLYIFAVAAIWIAASFVVQSVVDADNCGSLLFRRNSRSSPLEELRESEQAILLGEGCLGSRADGPSQFSLAEEGEIIHEILDGSLCENASDELTTTLSNQGEVANVGLDAKGRWTRTRVAKVSLSICPFWFLGQLAFNLSLKYTTVTSNAVLSSASSIFTFLVSLAFLGEKFSWIKLVSVLLCMTGTIIVSLGDSHNNKNLRIIASNPVLGDALALVAAALYAVYVTLIRKKLPDNDKKSGCASMAQFLGFLGLFNVLLSLPFALILHFTKLESLNTLSWKQFGLIIGKGLLDNVLSDYLWAKAVLLTTTTVATAGLAIQVPLAAIVDTIIGNDPHLMDYVGAAAVMIGFAGINIPSDVFCRAKEGTDELKNVNISLTNQEHTALPREETI